MTWRISRATCARAVWLGAFATAATTALAADPAHIRGTVVSTSGDTVTVRTADGNVKVATDASTKIAGIVPSSAAQIKAGTFVGIANVPSATGAASALEVVVFPDSMKGAGLGDYPWDLAPPVSSTARTSAMTNGTVTSADTSPSTPPSAMTNGTVRKSEDAGGLTLTVDYGKGEKNIHVPAGIPVVGIVPADASKLVPGAHVFISTRKDAPANAAFISVGIDGTVPPM